MRKEPIWELDIIGQILTRKACFEQMDDATGLNHGWHTQQNCLKLQSRCKVTLIGKQLNRRIDVNSFHVFSVSPTISAMALVPTEAAEVEAAWNAKPDLL